MRPDVFCRSAFNYDTDAASDETALDFSDEVSLTKQSFAEECDINTIVRNFGLTGQLPSDVRVPVYQDFEGVFDYQSALNAVIAAEDSFMQLPASLRSRFHNDPQALLEFVSDSANRDEAIRLGLVPEPAPAPPPSLQTGGEPPKAGGVAHGGGA